MTLPVAVHGRADVRLLGGSRVERDGTRPLALDADPKMRPRVRLLAYPRGRHGRLAHLRLECLRPLLLDARYDPRAELRLGAA